MKKELSSLFDIRSTAASLLALAVKQRFPSALQAGARATPLGFYCDFSFSGTFDPECLSQVEEVMQAWIRQKLDVKVQEMVSVSAREYFLFHKEPILADLIDASHEPSFFLAYIAGQATLFGGSYPSADLEDIGAFSLQKIEQVGSKLRIYGTAFPDKQALKEFIRVSGSYTSHTVLGKKLKLFEETEEGQLLWLPKGQKIRSLLKEQFEKEEEAFGFSQVSSSLLYEDLSTSAVLGAHQEIFEACGKTKLTEVTTFSSLETKDFSAGILDPAIFQGILSHVFCSKKDLLDELISYLHFMTKIFKLLDFAFQSVLFEVQKGKYREVSSLFSKALDGFEGRTETVSGDVPGIEWNVVDGLGRSWQVARVSAILSKQGEVQGFACSSCLSFERVLALLLEKSQGDLPFWLSPVQVRVVPLMHKHCEASKKLEAALKAEGLRTELGKEAEDLKEVLKRAREEGVPFVAVIGDRELETDTITLRDVRAKKAESLPWQELIKLLKKMKEIQRE